MRLLRATRAKPQTSRASRATVGPIGMLLGARLSDAASVATLDGTSP